MNEFRIADQGANRYALSGELTFDTVPDIWRDKTIRFESGGGLVIDLSGVSRADSAGLALLMEWTRTARERHVDIHFANIPEQMRTLARVSSLEPILPID